jgi:sulfite exporter TauE/SafE
VNELAPIIAASLVGSLHCVGMCGGLVTFYASTEATLGHSRSSQSPSRTLWAAHAAYHLTRLAAYVVLGASAGQLGAALDKIGTQLGLAGLGASFASLTIVLWALPLLLGRKGRERLLRVGRSPAKSRRWAAAVERWVVALARAARAKPPLWRASVLGLSSALLPCGWLYAFVVLAAGAGSAWGGGLLLAAFWLGTVPALLGLGLGVERLSRPLRAYLPRLGALLVLLVGGWNVAMRWPHAEASAQTLTGASPTPSCHAAQ